MKEPTRTSGQADLGLVTVVIRHLLILAQIGDLSLSKDHIYRHNGEERKDSKDAGS